MTLRRRWGMMIALLHIAEELFATLRSAAVVFCVAREGARERVSDAYSMTSVCPHTGQTVPSVVLVRSEW